MREFDLEKSLWDIIVDAFYNGLYYYSLFIMASYLILAFISFLSVRKYLHKSTFVNYNDILNTPIAPSVSILAPAYNESATIIENIRSLLSIHYSEFEVIIVNDGSKDDSLIKCINEYELEKVDFAVHQQLETQEIRGVYRSRNKAYSNLILVDKENGGKSDALNAGINVSKYDFITCIDVDCVLEQDAILKLMKPFVDETNEEIIATGGVIRIANSCIVENGRLMEVKVPRSFLARTQTLEYIRAFLLGRMAWAHLDGLILISGAMGVFKKDLAIEVGGYDKNTVGEDMELVVRMRRHMQEQKRPYQVAYIPDPLCWTEAPESWKILSRQRNRWTRGTIETLLKHKKMFFNPRYKLIGLLSYPYWFFFEWLAPLLEAFGILLFLLFAIVGLVNWSFFFLMIFLVYGFTICFSVLSLLIEEITYHQYKKHKDVLQLLQVGLMEPLLFHPFVVYSAVKGNIDFVLGKSNWGEMSRKGFAATAAKKIKVVQNVMEVASSSSKKKEKKTKVRLAALIVVIFIIGFTGIYFLTPEEQQEKQIYGYEVLVNAPKPNEKIAGIVEQEEDKRGFWDKLWAEDQEPDNEYVPIDDDPALVMNRHDSVSESEEEEPKFFKKISLDSAERNKASFSLLANSEEDEVDTGSSLLTDISKTFDETKAELTEATLAQQKNVQKPQKKEEKSVQVKSITPKATKTQEKAGTQSQLYYYLIAGSYKELSGAEKRRRELAAIGYDAVVVKSTDGTKIRVAFGEFTSKSDAYKLRDKLKTEGMGNGAWVLAQEKELASL